MDDMISRQAAIDALNDGAELLRRVLDEVDVVGNEREKFEWGLGLIESCIDDMKDLPSAQPEQQWIPCSERLPEEKDAGILKKLGTEKRPEYVLATVEVKGERMTVTACTYDGKWDWKMKYAFPDFKVVAWMPLPEPHREEEKHDQNSC